MPAGSRSDWPIIVGGCQRSGTTLIRRILDCHSRIHCAPEVKFFDDLYRTADHWADGRFMWTARSLAGTDELLDVLGGGFVELHERAARAAGKHRWADKTPENVLYTREWERLLGERWVFIHLIRNPLDTLASVSEAGRLLPVGTDGVERARHYRSYFEAGAGFGAEHPDRYRPVLYEQLVTQPTATLEGLMGFLGEALEPGQLAFNDRPRQVGLEDTKINATTEVHARSLHRWPSVLGLQEAELIWDLTADLWGQVDPDGRFVRPPAEPVGDNGQPSAGSRLPSANSPTDDSS